MIRLAAAASALLLPSARCMRRPQAVERPPESTVRWEPFARSGNQRFGQTPARGGRGIADLDLATIETGTELRLTAAPGSLMGGR
jgi:hypothetical protein